MRFLTAGNYLRTLILWVLLISFYSKVPVQNYKFDVPVIKCSYASQILMNIAENFASATNDHYVFHCISPGVTKGHLKGPEADVLSLSHTFDKHLNYTYQYLCNIQLFLNLTMSPSIPVHVTPMKISSIDQCYFSSNSGNKLNVIPFKGRTSDLDTVSLDSRSPRTQLIVFDTFTLLTVLQNM